MSLFKRYYPVLVAVLVAVLPLGMNWPSTWACTRCWRSL